MSQMVFPLLTGAQMLIEIKTRKDVTCPLGRVYAPPWLKTTDEEIKDQKASDLTYSTANVLQPIFFLQSNV